MAEAPIYETDRLRDEYLLFHYGKDEDILPWPEGPHEALGFAARTPQHYNGQARERALDLGCAVGRSSFELSAHFEEVIGIDYSNQFITAAKEMQSGQACEVKVSEEASVFKSVSLELPASARSEKVFFEQGDAHDLRNDLGNFDLVHAANLLCRLHSPEKLVAQFANLVRPGGQLVLATPCTWLEEYTPLENWPKGETLEWLSSQLAAHFDFVSKVNEPFLIRETRRKYQWTVSLVTVWERKA